MENDLGNRCTAASLAFVAATTAAPAPVEGAGPCCSGSSGAPTRWRGSTGCARSQELAHGALSGPGCGGNPPVLRQGGEHLFFLRSRELLPAVSPTSGNEWPFAPREAPEERSRQPLASPGSSCVCRVCNQHTFCDSGHT